MKTLPTKYKKNGYNHEIVYRENDIVISKLTSNESDRILCYEVFKVRIRKPSGFMNPLEMEWEATPSNEEWGTLGFTVNTIEQALKKVEWLKQTKKGGRKKIGKMGTIQKHPQVKE